MDRKKFIKSSFAIAALGFTSTSLFLESCSKVNTQPGQSAVNFTLDLSQSANSALNSSGGSVISHNVIVININGSFKALSDICTHEGCSVGFNKSSNKIICPCHGGAFDLNGSVLGGPPPSSLKQYSVTKSGNILTITG